MKKLIPLLALMIVSSAHAQWTPWGLGLIQKPNASSARTYLGIPVYVAGSNVVIYVDSFGRYVINSTGGGGGGGGTNGVNGTNATVTVGTTTTLAPGASATVVNSGSSLAAVLDFGIPAGVAGATGAAGANGTNGTNGANGINGTNGLAATISVASTTSVPYGDNATVVNVGSQYNAELEFEIPAGAPGTDGTNGATGPAGPPGTSIEVTNTGIALGTLISSSNLPIIGLKSLSAGSGVTITVTETNLEIAASSSGSVTSITNASPTLGASLITSSNSPIPSLKSVSVTAGLAVTDNGTNLTFGLLGGGSSVGIDYQLSDIPAYSNGTNFNIDFGYPLQIWTATNYALRYSTNWATGSTGRQASIFIPPTNITRRIYVYDAATNWQTAGMNSQYILAANQSALLRATLFGQGETNVSVSLIAQRAVQSGGDLFFNPLGIPGCNLWLDASRGLWQDTNGTIAVTNNGNLVKRWDDQSGAGNYVTNTLSTAVWAQFGAPNSLPSVLFNANESGSTFRSSQSNFLTQPTWTFIVWNRVVTNATQSPYASKNTTVNRLQVATSYGLNSGVGLTFSAPPTFSWMEIETKNYSASSSVGTNGVTGVSGNSGVLDAYGWTIGNTTAGGNPIAANVAEILSYNADLTTNNLADIRNYLRVKYSLY